MRARAAVAATLLTVASPICLAQVPDWSRRSALPEPRGPLAVGTTTLHLSDTSRGTSRHLLSRPLAVQVWYPARRDEHGQHAPYLIEPGLLDSMISRRYFDVPVEDMRAWADVRLAAHVNATPAAPKRPAGWPVLVFSHGLGVARAHYSSFSQELASRGYVVLAVEHPIGGFTFGPSGQVLTPGVDSLAYPYPRIYAPLLRDWAEDASYVVRLLSEGLRSRKSGMSGLRLDTAKVGMLGHSPGGRPRCKRVIPGRCSSLARIWTARPSGM